ncbi:MAG: copper-binding protein [Hyphomicrobium sp.]|uniref:copper-binding protein n=1 Tax=Hyphomicrobium sp. TaxID=82 RepID=UPI0013275532|nr:copper-binding protein [Hyphomicrobium sp.]KAB2943583.1 MAG: copper-binding protein [Hyphomicrobium sp.]MBZ0209688.1 copper-binding protein [Hyphomicrobium sp.]
MRMFLSAAFVMAAIAVSPISATFAHEGQDHPVVAGKVTKVDESAGKITIAHDAIPNLQMEAMTMVFKAGKPAMLKEVKPGDAIKFMADKVNGELTVIEIETAR